VFIMMMHRFNDRLQAGVVTGLQMAAQATLTPATPRSSSSERWCLP
jgi:hypothetical protein